MIAAYEPEALADLSSPPETGNEPAGTDYRLWAETWPGDSPVFITEPGPGEWPVTAWPLSTRRAA